MPGRNDPCPCGSGKKYKHCCLPEDQAHQRESARLLRAEEDLRQTLWRFAGRVRWDKQRAQALSEFSRGEVRTEHALSQDEALRFLDWFIHDYRLEDGRTVLQVFATEEGRRLHPEAQKLLEDWQHSMPGAFEVVNVRPGQGLILRDLVQATEYDVREMTASRQLNLWDIVLTRLVRVGRAYELEGGLRALPVRYRDALAEWLLAGWADYQDEHPGAPYDAFLRDTYLHLLHFVDDVYAEEAMPTIVTAEGDLLEWSTATYLVRDYERALAGLRGVEELEETGTPDDDPEALDFVWREDRGRSLELLRAHGPAFEHRPPMSTPGAEDGFRSLGHITLKRDKLTVGVQSQRRLAALKTLLADALGDAVTHESDEVKGQAELVRAAREKRPLAHEEAVSPELEEQLIGPMLAEHYRLWVDEPLPALDGKTPRQAVESYHGRQQVIALVKEIENSQERLKRQGRAYYDVSELKATLGLTDEEMAAAEPPGPPQIYRVDLAPDQRLSALVDYRQVFKGPEYAEMMREVGQETFDQMMDELFYHLGTSYILMEEPELQGVHLPMDPYDYLAYDALDFLYEVATKKQSLHTEEGGYVDEYAHMLEDGVARYLTPALRRDLISRLERIARRTQGTETGAKAEATAIGLDDPALSLGGITSLVEKLASDTLFDLILGWDERIKADKQQPRDPEVEALIDRLRRATWDEPDDEAVQALVARGLSAVPALEDLFYTEGLGYGDYLLYAAVQALGQIPSYRSLAILRQTMREDGDIVADLACESLSNMPDLAFNYLRYELTKAEPEWEMALYGYDFLAKHKPEGAFELIAAGLEGEKEDLWDMAASSLIELGDGRAIPLLRRALRDERKATVIRDEIEYVLREHPWRDRVFEGQGKTTRRRRRRRRRK